MNKRALKLVWSDEFDYEGRPDPEKWSYEVGNHQWPNNEAQAYTDRPANIRVEDGKMIITALKEQDGEREYTSAKLVTYGKASWKYGRIEVRAKLPGGRGAWPAIWMMPDSFHEGIDWPNCGEIDIMEFIPNATNSKIFRMTSRQNDMASSFNPEKSIVLFSLHSELHNHSNKDTVQYTHMTQEVETAATEFHTYGIDWTEDYIEFFVDDKPMVRYNKSDDNEDQSFRSWPFDQPFYLIMNIAVGGSLGGEIHDEDLPYVMEIESVKVYQ
ncbi:glycoside hydrolase family 16 protein [Clostridium thermarum]|uniref:glycoside hydrolase family 16 protein n=1 Tax=Clostridium thermarum TaxID=1716543 RepID=UPI001123075E|nr:glycoside hydrolase family 16 protein [Clostridium thermarum]